MRRSDRYRQFPCGDQISPTSLAAKEELEILLLAAILDREGQRERAGTFTRFARRSAAAALGSFSAAWSRRARIPRPE